jgi:D-glycero-alpha-D-manno-heptose-7-phosphate kinase
VRDLESHLLLFYTGIARTASQVAQSFVPHLHDRRRELRILKDMVDESIAILTGRQDIESFGALLHEAWDAKRSLSPQVSSSEIDDIYARARAAGALGGKLIGAGGGGFLLLFAPPERHRQLRDALAPLLNVPFTFEFSGSQVIFVDRQEDFAAEDKLRPLRAGSKIHKFVAPHTAAS